MAKKKTEIKKQPSSGVFSLFHKRHFPTQEALEQYNEQYFAQQQAKVAESGAQDAETTKKSSVIDSDDAANE